MNERTYIKPTVKLLTKNGNYLGFFIWMKSRQWIITDDDGHQFMRNLEYEDGWVSKIPSKFKVGDEEVELLDYMARIDAMNLQYNNSQNYVYEIDGSCLFRDFLFNINKIAQWAQSNRFLFSILDENARYDSRNYHISEEYKDIPEWEDQFDRYMDAIKNDPIVDHNRLEMPYSISSKFWICVNEKTLIELLNFMKGKVPFFYEVYGTQFMRHFNQRDEYSPTLTQYIIKNRTDVEGCTYVGDTVIVDSKMSLILYSQFIRQSDTLISGLYNQLIHEDAEEFKHKVFSGKTTFMIHYVADIDKALKTVSNRLCAFAMSSGTGPESWSYFLNRFLPNEITPTGLMNLLPCKFENNRLSVCKFHDDIKYRNEGKEISNIPCPLPTLSMEIAKAKKDRDNNRIGDAFYKLTEFLLKSNPQEPLVNK